MEMQNSADIPEFYPFRQVEPGDVVVDGASETSSTFLVSRGENPDWFSDYT